jgi:hypothetical protein
VYDSAVFEGEKASRGYAWEIRALTRTRLALHLLLAMVVSGLGRAQEPDKEASPPADRTILRIGNVQVTQAEFEARIGDIQPQADPDKVAEADKNRRQLGDDYASVLMLSEQAIANNLDSSPEVSRQLAVARLQILSDAQFASLQRQTAPTADEISQYYSAHLSDFDRVLIRRLFIWKTGAGSKNARGLTPEAARARADAILQASAAGGDPKKLAEEVQGSEDGVLDAEPITFLRTELPSRMEKAAFALKESEWSEAEDTKDAIILLHLVKRDRRPLGEVSSLLERRVHGQKIQAKLDEMKKNAGIWMDDDYFGPAPAAVPGAQHKPRE